MKRNKTSGVSACKCDVCGVEHPSTINGKKHRRCGGAAEAPVRGKRSRGSVRGTWR